MFDNNLCLFCKVFLLMWIGVKFYVFVIDERFWNWISRVRSYFLILKLDIFGWKIKYNKIMYLIFFKFWMFYFNFLLFIDYIDYNMVLVFWCEVGKK